MFEQLLALMVNMIVPFGVGLFFYVISPNLKDGRMCEIARKSGIVMIAVAGLWFAVQALGIVF
ncbi:hypothetical protein AB6A23_17080 [Paenibacillus tarimensis]